MDAVWINLLILGVLFALFARIGHVSHGVRCPTCGQKVGTFRDRAGVERIASHRASLPKTHESWVDPDPRTRTYSSSCATGRPVTAGMERF